MKTLLRASWIAPMDRPAFRDGAVVFSGETIVDVGPISRLQKTHPDAQSIDLGDSILLPGLINAHTHLELSHCTPEAPGMSFTDWILSLASRMNLNGRTRNQAAAEATRHGIEQCLRFGVTTVGDIAQSAHAVRQVLRQGPIRSISFGEAIGLGKSKAKFETRLAAAIDPSLAGPLLRIGLSPHAPYSVDLDGWQRCLALADERHLPLATHLAETAHEAEFLLHHAGEFRELLETLQLWDESIETIRLKPMPFARKIGLLDRPTLLAHVNYCADDDLQLLATGQASVVYCPRTHAYFGHPPHRWREMLLRGINVTVGTDSCASSPDLNLLDDLRLLHKIAPEMPAQSLWELATTRSARALRWEDRLGSLTPGKRADFAVFPALGDDPLLRLLETTALPTATWIAGRPIQRG